MGRFDAFAGEVEKWTAKINLVAPGTLGDIWRRHIADSAQLFDVAGVSAGLWLDAGSGGGFPAVVVAILALEKAPRLRFKMVDSDTRKAAFLQTVTGNLGLHATVVNRRVEELPPTNADIVSARALAPLGKLLTLTARHRSNSGLLLFPKGRNYRTELTGAARCWKLAVEEIPSRTDPDSVILRISEAVRV